MWSDQEIKKRVDAINLHDGQGETISAEDVESLLRQMRDEYDIQIEGIRLVAAQMVASERLVQDALNLALTEAQPSLALVGLLNHYRASLVCGPYLLSRNRLTGGWTIMRTYGADWPNVYSGDLAGALVVLKRAAGVGDHE